MVGNEGMLGCNLLMAINSALFIAIVHKSGSALRITAKNFIQELQNSLKFQQILQRYLFVSFNSLVQNSSCNSFHVVEKRLARLLLMIRDRAQSVSFFCYLRVACSDVRFTKSWYHESCWIIAK